MKEQKFYREGVKGAKSCVRGGVYRNLWQAFTDAIACRRYSVPRSVFTASYGILVVSALVLAGDGCEDPGDTDTNLPEKIVADGAYTHAESGMTFPEQVGSFLRTDLTRYDADFNDVSAGYDAFPPTGPLSATVYVYPAPKIVSIGSPKDVVNSARNHLAEGEYAACKQEIMRAHPGGKLVSESRVRHAGARKTFLGRKAVFEFDSMSFGVQQTFRSELIEFHYVADRWVVKYRFTYPKDIDMSKYTEAFIDQLEWTLEK